MINQEHLAKQLAFLREAEKLKTIFRKNIIIDRSHAEDDAQHSWNIALLAMTLYEYADAPGIDLLRVLKMTLLHDLVEIYAGDSFCFEPGADLAPKKQEAIAAEKIFGQLPDAQRTEYHELWREFERMETPDAVFAAAMDRLQPFLLDCHTEGHTWKLGKISEAQLLQRMEPVRRAIPALWPLVTEMAAKGLQCGWLKQ